MILQFIIALGVTQGERYATLMHWYLP